MLFLTLGAISSPVESETIRFNSSERSTDCEDLLDPEKGSFTDTPETGCVPARAIATHSVRYRAQCQLREQGRAGHGSLGGGRTVPPGKESPASLPSGGGGRKSAGSQRGLITLLYVQLQASRWPRRQAQGGP